MSNTRVYAQGAKRGEQYVHCCQRCSSLDTSMLLTVVHIFSSSRSSLCTLSYNLRYTTGIQHPEVHNGDTTPGGTQQGYNTRRYTTVINNTRRYTQGENTRRYTQGEHPEVHNGGEHPRYTTVENTLRYTQGGIPTLGITGRNTHPRSIAGGYNPP